MFPSLAEAKQALVALGYLGADDCDWHPIFAPDAAGTPATNRHIVVGGSRRPLVVWLGWRHGTLRDASVRWSQPYASLLDRGPL
jgi:hypothetical protein